MRAAIGNLLRNANENSDNGTIWVRTEAPGTITIEDPGHGLSGEVISQIYSHIAHGGGGRGGSGSEIGLDLTARLRELLGWSLEFTQAPDKGRSIGERAEQSVHQRPRKVMHA